LAHGFSSLPIDSDDPAILRTDQQSSIDHQRLTLTIPLTSPNPRTIGRINAFKDPIA
jgi:hypothetical protein